MKLQEGKIYKTRNGLTTNPLKLSNNGTNYKFESEMNDPKFSTPSVCSWTETGKYLTHVVENELDLIEEINQ